MARRLWGRNPWWVPPFLGQVPKSLADRHLRLLGAVSLALFVEEYDLSMLTAALRDIAADLGMAETDLGMHLGLIRLGALPAFAVIPLADRIGRRTIFLWALAITGQATFLTGLAQTPLQFTLAQMTARAFFVSGIAVAFVIVAEELPASDRGWGIGMLGALAATGHGLGVAFFGLIDVLHFSWRWLYVVGLAPVVALPLFARAVPETARFTQHRLDRDEAAVSSGVLGSMDSLLALGRTRPLRAVGIALLGFLPAMGFITAFQFTGYFALEVHGWSRSAYAAMVVLGGAIGIVGNIVAGRLGDRFGRRRVGLVMLGLFPLFVAGFYRGPGWMLPIAWVLFLFASQGGRVTLRSLAAEVFPTGSRSAASGLFNIMEAIGAAAGLFVVYFGSDQQGDLALLTPYVALASAAGGLLLFLFPETRRRELEAID